MTTATFYQPVSSYDYNELRARAQANADLEKRVKVLSASLLVRSPSRWAEFVYWKQRNYHHQNVIEDLAECETYLCHEHQTLDDLAQEQDERELRMG